MKNPEVMLDDFLRVYLDVGGPYTRPPVLNKVEEIREKSEPTAANTASAVSPRRGGSATGAIPATDAAEVIDLAGVVAKKVDPLIQHPAKRRV
jgi:hypothetical protein